MLFGVAGERPERPSGNLVLDQVLGAKIRFCGPDGGGDDSLAEVCAELLQRYPC